VRDLVVEERAQGGVGVGAHARREEDDQRVVAAGVAADPGRGVAGERRGLRRQDDGDRPREAGPAGEAEDLGEVLSPERAELRGDRGELRRRFDEELRRRRRGERRGGGEQEEGEDRRPADHPEHCAIAVVEAGRSVILSERRVSAAKDGSPEA
jgi:hypothetical protein